MSNEIRQPLLENEDLTLSAAFKKTRSLELELAQKNANSFNRGYAARSCLPTKNVLKEALKLQVKKEIVNI